MEFMGFLKEEDENIKSAMNFKDMFTDIFYEEDLRFEIIKYLENGYTFGGIMTYLYDNDGLPIGGIEYKTDGYYIWPNYYYYYLKKYNNFFISNSLIDYLKEKKFKMSLVEKKDLINIDNIFSQEWSVKSNKVTTKAQKSFYPKFKI